MPDRIIRVILTGDSAGAVRAFKVAGDAAEATEGKFARMRKVGEGISSLGRVMTTIAAPMVGLGAVAVKSATTYEQSMTRIRTQTSMTASDASGIAAHFTKMAGQLGFSSTQLSQGLYPIASEGLKGAKALQALTAAAKGAKIGGDDLTTTASALSSVLGANFKDIHSANEAMVVMERTAGLGKMQLQDLTAAMGTGVTSEATGMGIGLRDLGAALGAMTKQGVPAEQEASRLKLSLTKMAAPTGVALKQVQALGMGQFELARDLRKPEGMIVALRDLQAHISGLGENQQNAALANMFGQSRGLSNIRGLLRALPAMTQIRGGLQSATASQFGKRWQEQAQTPAQKFADMLAKIKTAVTQLGVALMPMVMAILPKLASDVSKVVGFFTGLPKPVRDVVAGFTAFLAIGGPVLMLTGKMITSFVSIKEAITAMKITTEVASGAMKATIVGGMIFVLIELLTHFKQVKQFAETVFKGLERMAEAVGHAFSKMIHPFLSIGNSVLHGSWLHSLSFGLLSTGGPVKAKYLDTGGPVGTDTVPGWLTPGEYVLNRAATSRIGIPALNRMNAGASFGDGGGAIEIQPVPMTIQLDSRTIWKGLMHYTSSRAARGTSPVGGAMLTGGVA